MRCIWPGKCSCWRASNVKLEEVPSAKKWRRPQNRAKPITTTVPKTKPGRKAARKQRECEMALGFRKGPFAISRASAIITFYNHLNGRIHRRGHAFPRWQRHVSSSPPSQARWSPPRSSTHSDTPSLSVLTIRSSTSTTSSTGWTPSTPTTGTSRARKRSHKKGSGQRMFPHRSPPFLRRSRQGGM